MDIYFWGYNITENPSRLVGYITKYSPELSFECYFQWCLRLKRRYFPHYAVHLRREIDVLWNRLKIKDRKWQFPVGHIINKKNIFFCMSAAIM